MRASAEVRGNTFAHCGNPRRSAFERVARDGKIDLKADRPEKAADVAEKTRTDSIDPAGSIWLDLIMVANGKPAFEGVARNSGNGLSTQVPTTSSN
jgi:hypothetical protein